METGGEQCVHCSEVVPSSEVRCMETGLNSVSIVQRLSLFGGRDVWSRG